MAISHFPQIINGTYDLYSVPLSSFAPDTGNQVHLGCLQEGFTLNWSSSSKDVQSDCMGDTVIDGVYTGIENAKIDMIVHEWDGQRTAVEPLMWPLNSGTSLEFGDLGGIGKMVNMSVLGLTLRAVPRTGTPAAVNTASWWFYCMYMTNREEFNANFNREDQIVPMSLKAYPVATHDTIATNKIYHMGTAAATLTADIDYPAQYSWRVWRREATP